MPDYFSPRPAVLIATSRSGSTFLLHCLDSHPQIGCDRGEPLSPRDTWANLLWGRDISREDLMRILWQRPGYRVTMFKLSYRHLKRVGTEILKEIKPAILHLHRKNTLRVIVSSAINTAVVNSGMRHPIHSFEPATEPASIWISPESVLSECRRYRRNTKAMTKKLRKLGLPLLFLTYEDLVGREGNEAGRLPTDTAQRIATFLNVDELTMFSQTRRINPYPLSQIVENWPEVAGAVANSEFKRNLEPELETA